MSRILITGNRGFFGARFHSLYDHRHEVLGIDKDDVDIVDAAAVARCVDTFKPEIVIHAAAITATAFSNEHPELTTAINVDGAVNVAIAAREAGARLIFSSTEQVFNGNAERGPYTEADTPVPNTMYGRTKLEAEDRLREIIDELWILRFTWLFGLPERDMPLNPNILWNALQIVLRGTTTTVPVDEYRGYTWGYDMLEAVMRVPRIPYGTYHIGSRNDLGRYELTRAILHELGLNGARIDALVKPDRDTYREHPRDARLDASAIAAHGITFAPTIDAIRRALDEFGLRGVAG